MGTAVEHVTAAVEAPGKAAIAPSTELHGWDTGQALSQAAEHWTAFLKHLGGQIQEFGADLTKAANAYRDTDEAAASRVSNAGSGMVYR